MFSELPVVVRIKDRLYLSVSSRDQMAHRDTKLRADAKKHKQAQAAKLPSDALVDAKRYRYLCFTLGPRL
jgi:hypothetical protein